MLCSVLYIAYARTDGVIVVVGLRVCLYSPGYIAHHDAPSLLPAVVDYTPFYYTAKIIVRQCKE
jgi:hypothetical protein